MQKIIKKLNKKAIFKAIFSVALISVPLTGFAQYNPANYSSSNTYSPTSYSSSNTYRPTTYSSSNTYRPSTYSSSNTYSPTTYSSSNTYRPSTYSSSNTYSPTSYSSSNTYRPTTYSVDMVSSNTNPYVSSSIPNYYGGETITDTTITDTYTYLPTSYGSNGYYGSSCYNCGYTYYGGNTGCGSNCHDNDDEDDLSGSCEASKSEIYEGESVTWRAEANGGDGDYSYSWSGDASGNGRTVSERYNSSGTKTARVRITSDGESITRTCTVRVIEEDDDDDNLTATCDTTPSRVEEGETVRWEVDARGGNGNYSYSWSGDVSGNSRVETRSYSSSGTKYGTVRVTSGNQTITKQCSVVVEDEDDNDDLRAVCDVTPDNPEEGDTVRWSVKVYGGDGDYEYDWSGDVSGDNRTETKRYNSSGRKEATVRIESDGDVIRKTCSVYVDDENNRYDYDRDYNYYGGTSYYVPPAQTGTVTSGVFLSQLPYTGFDSNTKIALFVIGLALWSAGLSYIFIKRKNKNSLKQRVDVKAFKEANLKLKNS